MNVSILIFFQLHWQLKSRCLDTRWETGIILTPSFQTKSAAVIRRLSNILKCQAHHSKTGRRWKPACGRGSKREGSLGMTFDKEKKKKEKKAGDTRSLET